MFERPRLGPIPARAGEPLRVPHGPRRTGAYPRASGGTALEYIRAGFGKGLSPRERGNQRLAIHQLQPHGPIPARAGEPRGNRRAWSTRRAYPRASGGTLLVRRLAGIVGGLSPRERGNRILEGASCDLRGPIPARAGEPQRSPRSGRSSRAYPRASGGTRAASAALPLVPGLSPRERGNLPYCQLEGGGGGPIPARAGEPEDDSRTPNGG